MMEYKVRLDRVVADDKELRPAEAISLMLFAIAERLERIAELMEQAQFPSVLEGQIRKPYSHQSSLEHRRYQIDQDIIKRNMQP